MRQLKISKSITNRESASLDSYLSDIGKIELISALEEVELTQKIKLWDEQALEKLVKANLRFVVSVAKQYQNQGLSLPDLINEGNLWLIKAAQKFDETRGFKFISYAVWWIRQAILGALAEQARIVRLPLNKVWSIQKINKAFSVLEQELWRTPTSSELANLLEISEETIEQSLKYGQRAMSLDNPLTLEDSDSNTFLDTMTSEDIPNTDHLSITASLQKDIFRVLNTLNERERKIICMYFGIGMNRSLTLDEIWENFYLKKERIIQIKDKAIKKMKKFNRSQLLKKYLG